MTRLPFAVQLVFRSLGGWLAVCMLAVPPARAGDDRILSIDVSPDQSGDYVAAFDLALDAGMDEIGLSFGWNSLEVAPGEFDDEDLLAANAFYPQYGMPVRLMISPIRTNITVLPPDLDGLPLDDPAVIARFNELLDHVASVTPDLDVSAIILGNEYDVYLGTDPDAWAAYTTFVAQTSAHARQVWPAARIGAEATLPGAIGPAYPLNLALNAHCDSVFLSYYPLNGNFTVQDPSVVAGAFDAVCDLYPGPIEFEEMGYPSGERNQSSEAQQAEFVRAVFAAWDAHADQVGLVDFTWMHDVSPRVARLIARAYGIRSPRFVSYLGTLGLRTYEGAAKAAWTALVEEADARGMRD